MVGQPLLGLVLSTIAWHAYATVNSSSVHWDASIGHYVDGEGRARIFHGMNVVYKESPWLPRTDNFTAQTSLADKDMDLLQEWGFNAVRLGIMWPGVEPEHKNISQGYLQDASTIVDKLGQRGVYTILDLHQDVGSRRFCGEGFPEYYVDALFDDPSSKVAQAEQFPSPFHSPPVDASNVPSLADCLKNQFTTYYATTQVGALWQTLYESGSDLNSGFLRFWAAVAAKFKHAETLIGYELINEPSGWCIEGSCEIIPKLDNSIEKEFLTPLYRAAASKIRESDPNHIIFYEATTAPKEFDNVFPELVLANDTQQGLAYHIYCLPNDQDGTFADLACKVAQDLYTHEYYNYLEAFPVAGFMTEFGDIGQTPGELDHLNRLLGFSDDRFQSWTYWQLKLYHDFTTANKRESFYGRDGKLQLAKLAALSRTYAQAVAGIPSRMVFDPASAAFQLDFTPTAAKAPTEIYLNEDLHYPNGYSVSVSPPGCVTPERTKNLLSLHPTGNSCIGKVVSIKLAAKDAKKQDEIIV